MIEDEKWWRITRTERGDFLYVASWSRLVNLLLTLIVIVSRIPRTRFAGRRVKGHKDQSVIHVTLLRISVMVDLTGNTCHAISSE